MADNETWDGGDRRPDVDTIRALTADIVAAHVSNNIVSIGDLPQLITNVHGALGGLAGLSPGPKPEPKVPVRSSVKPDYIACLECGGRFKTIKRHLIVEHDATPEQYRAKWGLPSSYPMVASAYSEQRRALARSIGLGRGDKRPK